MPDAGLRQPDICLGGRCARRCRPPARTFAAAVFNARRRQPGGRVVSRGWEGFPTFKIIHVAGSFLGRDYRSGGCRLPDAYEQLAFGSGTEPAWKVVRAQRRHRHLGALLPGEGAKGALFVFAGGRADLIETKVGEIRGSLTESE